MLKLRSLSLSLDALLDYNDKDIDESTFELSLFAESLYEMLLYQMGCRVLGFHEKLRLRFVSMRNQKKRQENENHEKGSNKEEPSSAKRLKMTDEAKEDSKPEKPDIANPESDISMLKEVDTGTEPESDDESRKDNRMDEEDLDEDPDENPEEYVDEDDASDEENNEDKTSDMEVKTTNEASDKMDDTKGSHDEKNPDKNDKVDPKSVGEEGKDKEEIGTEQKSFASGKDS